MKRILTSLAVATILLCQETSVWACPMCKHALESDPNEPKAYMFSILFMMGMITSLFATVAGLLWWVSKQDKMVLDAAGYQHIFENGVSQMNSAPPKSDR